MKVKELGRLKFESSFSVCVNSCLALRSEGWDRVISNLELTLGVCVCVSKQLLLSLCGEGIGVARVVSNLNLTSSACVKTAAIVSLC